jgi:site-specific DNA-methyltransferase (adenine-specific)
MTPYYEQDGITIFNADCREVLPSIKADVMLTDPPFGVGKAAWDTEFVLPPSAPVLTLGLMPGVSNILRCPVEIDGLVYLWTLSALLTNGMTRGALGFGNWIPCLIYAAGGYSVYGQRQDAKAFAIGADSKQDHPCPKPLNVTRWFLSCLPGDLVLDPFMGSGTTLVAAKLEGRRAIGIEIEERYCEIAANRLAQGVLFGVKP